MTKFKRSRIKTLAAPFWSFPLCSAFYFHLLPHQHHHVPTLLFLFFFLFFFFLIFVYQFSFFIFQAGLSVGSKRMGKVSPKEKTRRVKGRRQSRSSGNKYLRPGTLAQLRCSKPSGSASAAGKCCCTDLGKKRVAVLHARKSAKRHDENARVFDKSPVMRSPVNLVSHGAGFVGTPKTPRLDDSLSESRLESLPMELIVCFTWFNFLELLI